MITQRFTLAGGYPGGTWMCAGCGAELQSGEQGTLMEHRDDCPEIGLAASLGRIRNKELFVPFDDEEQPGAR